MSDYIRIHPTVQFIRLLFNPIDNLSSRYKRWIWCKSKRGTDERKKEREREVEEEEEYQTKLLIMMTKRAIWLKYLSESN